MIQIKNQIICKFSLGDQEDFITPENLKEFRIFEMAGNRRPIIHLSFNLENKKIIKYLNSGNILRLSFGINEIKQDVIEFELYGDDTNVNYQTGYTVTLKGALYVNSFTSLVGCEIYTGSSLEVFKQIANKHSFGFKTNIERTNDKMIWERNGQTEWEFLSHLWLHSFINEDTFISFAFDEHNFYLYDVRQQIKSGAKWILTNKYLSTESSNIIHFGSYTCKNIYGTLSDVVGKNLINKTYNMKTGKIQDDSYKLKTLSTIDTDKININTTNCKQYDYFIMTGNEHNNYVKAYNQNLRNNIMYSSFITYLSTAGQFKKIRLLDTVKFDIEPTDNRLSGTGFITEIVYQYVGMRLLINLTINKESPSGIQGKNLKEGE